MRGARKAMTAGCKPTTVLLKREKRKLRAARGSGITATNSPNQVLTHAARAAAKQLNKVPFQAPLVAARGAREGLWSE